MTDVTETTDDRKLVSPMADLDSTPDDPRALAALVDSRNRDAAYLRNPQESFPVGFDGLPERDEWVDRADEAGLLPAQLSTLWATTREAYVTANQASYAARRVEDDHKAAQGAVDAGIREAVRTGKPMPKAAPVFDLEAERRRRTAVAAGLRDAAQDARRAYDEAFRAAGDAWLTEATAALSSRHADVAEAVEVARALVGQLLARIEVAQSLLSQRGDAPNTLEFDTLQRIEQGFEALAGVLADERSHGVNLADPFMEPPLRVRKLWAWSLRNGAPDQAAWELHSIERGEQFQVTDLTRGMESLRQ